MATRLTHQMTYQADAEQVAAMLADPAFREQVSAAQKVLRSDVSVSTAGTTTVVRVEQAQAAAGLPSFATRLVGDEIVIVQEETWTGDHADVVMEIPGKPGEITGTMALVEDGGTTTQTVDLSVTVRIPLVGGKVEQLVADMLTRALRKEEQVGKAWLAG